VWPCRDFCFQPCPHHAHFSKADSKKPFDSHATFWKKARPGTNDSAEFDQLCASLGLEHRLTKPKTLRTNGVVERFDGCTTDVLRSHQLQSGLDLEQTLLGYVAIYNHQLPQSAPKSRTPFQAMKVCYAKRPDLFAKRPYDHPGCDK
jgi:hypothetical protein